MAWQIPIASSSTFTNIGGNSLYVASEILLADRVYATGTNQQIVVDGTISGSYGYGIWWDGGSNNRITVNGTGVIRSFDSHGIDISSASLTIDNHGIIYAPNVGIGLYSFVPPTTTSVLLNSGTIYADAPGSYGLARPAGYLETWSISNTGIISGKAFSFGQYFGDSVARDIITNAGRMIGDIGLGSGNDTYSGATGHLTGKLFGGPGVDVAIGGTDNDWFEGGTENDTLTGNRGSDRLFGQNGNDTLTGGLGNDYLTGGANNDYFVFNTAPNASTNRDTITDFNHVADTFKLENAVFTKLGAGVHALSAAFFRAGTKALDGNDYIVYNKATGMLSYDSDGNGAHAAIQFAELKNKPVLAANDFLVI